MKGEPHMKQQDNGAITRRGAIAMGLTGLAATGMGVLGVPAAKAEESGGSGSRLLGLLHRASSTDAEADATAGIEEETPAAEESAAVAVSMPFDLSALSDDELLQLESSIANEKVKRGINSAIVPPGLYTAGVDFDPGSYVIVALVTEDDTIPWSGLGQFANAEAMNAYEYVFYDLLSPGTSKKVTLDEGAILEVEVCSVAMSPFQKLSFGS